MISVNVLQSQLYSAFRLLAATGLPLEVVYQGVVYQVYVRPTDLKPIYSTGKRVYKTKPKINTWKLNYGDCRACGYMTVNDNCLNFACPTLKTDPKRPFNYERAEQESRLIKEKNQRNAGSIYNPDMVDETVETD